MNIDLELLKTQKGQLVPIVPFFEKAGNMEAVKALDGIINMLDAIQDELEDNGEVTLTKSNT